MRAGRSYVWERGRRVTRFDLQRVMRYWRSSRASGIEVRLKRALSSARCVAKRMANPHDLRRTRATLKNALPTRSSARKQSLSRAETTHARSQQLTAAGGGVSQSKGGERSREPGSITSVATKPRCGAQACDVSTSENAPPFAEVLLKPEIRQRSRTIVPAHHNRHWPWLAGLFLAQLGCLPQDSESANERSR
jgi:hypothetical protein